MKSTLRQTIKKILSGPSGLDDGIYLSKILSAIRARDKECLGEVEREVIGEDEFVGKPHMIYYEVGGRHESYSEEKYRNELKALQRAKLSALKKKL